LLKWNASKSWKKLVKLGLNLKSQWKSSENVVNGTDTETTSFIGNTLIEVLKSPDLSVPALLKEDNCVEFHSSFQQFMYEYLFRQQDLQSGVKPKVNFTYLSEEEEYYRDNLDPWVFEAEDLAKEINENYERDEFFKLRWYWTNQFNFM